MILQAGRVRREKGRVRGRSVRERSKENFHKHSKSPFIWSATHFKVRCKTIFVRTRAKSNQPRCLLMLFFIFKITHCIHIQISLKFIHQTPVFQQLALIQHQKLQSVETQTQTSAVRSNTLSDHSWFWDLPPVILVSSRLSRLQIHDPWPTTSKPNWLWGRIQNDLKWMKWQDRHCYW